MVWKKMEKIIKYCQWMMDKKIKYFICMEAVRTKAAQIKYQLLQMYMDWVSIVDYVQLWKQMVTFFVCMQGKESKKPKY